MGTTRFIRDSSNAMRNAGGTYPRVCNGNGAYAGAPALVETADAPMSNALVRDKGLVWTAPGDVANIAGTDVALDIDLGANKVLNYLALFGVLRASFPSSFFAYYRTAAQGYDAVTANWSSMPMAVQGFADGGVILSAPVTARYVRYIFFFGGASGTPWSVGKLVGSTSVTDLGQNPNYGGSEDTELQVGTTRNPYTGRPVRTFTGTARKRWAMPFVVTTAVKDLIRSTFIEQFPVVLIDYNDVFYEVVPIQNTLRCVPTFMDLWNVSFEVEES